MLMVRELIIYLRYSTIYKTILNYKNIKNLILCLRIPMCYLNLRLVEMK